MNQHATVPWRTYQINGREFYAPNLDYAFHLARLRFGSATLTCAGSRAGR